MAVEVGKENKILLTIESALDAYVSYTLVSQDLIRNTSTYLFKLGFANGSQYKNIKLVFNSPITFSCGRINNNMNLGYPYIEMLHSEVFDLTNSNITLNKATSSSTSDYTYSDWVFSTTVTVPHQANGTLDGFGFKFLAGENVTERANASATIGYQEVGVSGNPILDNMGSVVDLAPPPAITLVDTVIFSNDYAYVGDNYNIGLDTSYYDSTTNFTLTYEIKSERATWSEGNENGFWHTTSEQTIKTGTIIENTPLTEVVWTIPMDVFSECNGATRVKCILTCEVNYNGRVVDTVTKNIYISLDVNGIGPYFLNTDAYDINPVTYALTGDDRTLIKYFSDYYVDTGAYVHQDAYKAGSNYGALGYTYTCGQFTRNWGVGQASGFTNFPEAESDTIDIKAFDMLGNTAYTQVNLPMIDYTKLTCNLFTTVIAGNGTMKVTIEGMYFDDTFGAVDNTLNLYYRINENIDEEGNPYGVWIEVTPTISNGNYKAEFIISGLNYQSVYYVQARAVDKLMDVPSVSRHITGQSVYDWSREDFNFNVPVIHQRNITLDTQELSGIHGTTIDGTDLELMALKSDNNLHIGFGGYSQEIGATYIYGNDIHMLSSLHGDISIVGMANAMTQAYEFEPEVLINQEAADAWNVQVFRSSCALTLRGNCLYCRFYVSFSELTPIGDFDDLFAGRVVFNHGGKITGMDYVTGVTGTSGPTAGLTMANVIVDETTAQFDMYVTNSAAAGYNFIAGFAIPVSLNLNAFV